MRQGARLMPSLVLATGLALTTSAAVADDDDAYAPLSTSQCTASRICLWTGASSTGLFASATSTIPVPTGFPTARSVWNRSSHAARVYSGVGGTGTSTCFAPGARTSSTLLPAASFRVLSSTSC